MIQKQSNPSLNSVQYTALSPQCGESSEAKNDEQMNAGESQNTGNALVGDETITMSEGDQPGLLNYPIRNSLAREAVNLIPGRF